MISQKLLKKLNDAARNPEAVQVIIYNLKTDEGVFFDRPTGVLSCVCGFCRGQNLVVTSSHINVLTSINGFLKNYPSNQIGLDSLRGKYTKAHGTDNAQPSPTDSGNPTGL